MLIKCGLPRQTVKNWDLTPEDVKIDLKIIASRSKHAPVLSKVIYSIVELIKNIFGSNSDYQKAFNKYQTEAPGNLMELGLDPADFQKKDYKIAFNLLLERNVMENDLKIEDAIAHRVTKEMQALKEQQKAKLPERLHPLLDV